MFGSKNKKQKEQFETASRRFLTGSGLLKAALANDKEQMKILLSTQVVDEADLEFVLYAFLRVANRYPEVIERLEELTPQMPEKAQEAFTTGVLAARQGNPGLVQSSSRLGSSLLLVYLAGAISEDDAALVDAMLELKEGMA